MQNNLFLILSTTVRIDKEFKVLVHIPSKKNEKLTYSPFKVSRESTSSRQHLNTPNGATRTIHQSTPTGAAGAIYRNTPTGAAEAIYRNTPAGAAGANIHQSTPTGAAGAIYRNTPTGEAGAIYKNTPTGAAGAIQPNAPTGAIREPYNIGDKVKSFIANVKNPKCIMHRKHKKETFIIK